MMAHFIADSPSPRYGIHMPAEEMLAREMIPSSSTFRQMSPPRIPVSKKNNSKKTRMPPKYKPDENAVICGRGKVCTSNPGNQTLRALIDEHLDAYGKAGNKVEKTEIVSSIMDTIKKGCPDEPSFVKKEGDTWWEVDDAFAREKIGCIFRDALYTKYRSSTKAKLARRKSQIGSDDKMGISTSSSESASNFSSGLMPPPSYGAQSLPSTYEKNDFLKGMGRMNFNSMSSSYSSGGGSMPSNGKNVDDYCYLLNNYLGRHQDSQPPQWVQMRQPPLQQASFSMINHQEHSRNMQIRQDLYRLTPASMGLPSTRMYANPTAMVEEAYSVVQSLQQSSDSTGTQRPRKDYFKKFLHTDDGSDHEGEAPVPRETVVVRKVRSAPRTSSSRHHQRGEDDLVSLPDDISDIFD